MDYSKIRLNNERNEHVTKRLNRLSTWKFFKVLYRDNMWRLFGFSLLMLICMLPIFGVQIWSNYHLSQYKQTLPTLNGLGFTSGLWTDLSTHYANASMHNTVIFGLITVGAALLMFITFSGGFGVIRDAFWTGKLSKVGVFKSMGKGIKAGWAYALITMLVGGFALFGTIVFYKWMAQRILWLAIVLVILMAVVLLMLVTYLSILCSVAVTYKQSVHDNLDDSWRLMWLNFLPNILHLIIALVPIALYFVFRGGILQSIYIVLMIMFGGMFFPLVWHTHMMRTFALFHPVEKKKKGGDDEQAEQPAEEAPAEDAAPAEAQQAKPAKKGGKKKAAVPAAQDAAPEVPAEDAAPEAPADAAEDVAPADAEEPAAPAQDGAAD